MFRRCLFVGLGGAGGKTLRFLKDEIRRWMREHELPGPIPPGWQFLHIDSPPVPDGDEINHLVPPIGHEEYVGLVEPGVGLGGVFAQLKAQLKECDDRFIMELASWLPSPNGLFIPLDRGAGQFRAVGAAVGLAYADRIRQGLAQSLNRVNHPDAQLSLNEIQLRFQPGTPPPEGAPPDPLVIVISSLAGGAGSGLLPPVCDLLSAEPPVGPNGIIWILYTSEVFSEVFDSLPDAMKAGVHANELAALCEIMNAHWWRGEAVEDPMSQAAGTVWPDTSTPNRSVVTVEDPMSQAAGTVGAVAGGGPLIPFVVGARNSAGISFASPDQVFEHVGLTLRSWLTDEVQSHFIYSVIANYAQSAVAQPMGPILVDEGHPSEKGYPPFLSLGSARLSLGTDQFERYAITRLSTDALVHLAKNHFLGPWAADKRHNSRIVDPEQLANAIAKDLGPWFRKEAQIEESGDEPGDIRTALAPPQSHRDSVLDDCRDLFDRLIDIDSPNIVKDELFPEFERKFREALYAQAAEWVSSVQERVLGVVEEAIVKYGLRVAEKLCLCAAAYLRDVGTELRENIAPGLRGAAAQWQQHTQAGVSLGGKKKRPSTHWFRRSALKAMVTEEAAALAPRLADGVFEPLAAELKRAAVLLADEARGEQAIVPGEFDSPTGEFTLIDVDEFEQWFERLLDKGDGQDGQVRARMEVSRQLLKIVQEWSPDRPWITDPPRSLAIDANCSRHALERRAAEVLNEEGTPFGEFLTLGLRAALDDSAAHAVLNSDDVLNLRRRFLARLAQVVLASAPLVGIDFELANQVSPGGFRDAARLFSALPFEGHRMRDAVQAVLVAEGIPPGVVAQLFNSDDRVRHIDVTSVLEAPQSILAMSSVLRSIANSWEAAKRGGHVARWWLLRRTRPLRRFVPCPQAHLRCMIRGWFTGRILGLIAVMDDGRVRIARAGHDAVDFPYPALSEPHDNSDRMAIVLEALALAYVEVARVRNLDPLEPYRRLLALGRLGDGPSGAICATPSGPRAPRGPLTEWIDSGQQPAESLTGVFRTLLVECGDNPSPGGRRRALISVLDQARDQYGREFDRLAAERKRDPDLFARAPVWVGLWPMIGEELARMCDAIGRYRPAGNVS